MQSSSAVVARSKQIQQRPWYVLTGAVSSGKSTLLAELSRSGIVTHDEVARKIIDRKLSEGLTLDDIRGKHEHAFNAEVAAATFAREDAANQQQVSFFDRGLPDLVAWARALDYPEPDRATASARGWRYGKVFLLDLLPIEQDYARVETEEFNAQLHQHLIRAYRDSGEEVLIVPVMPVAERKQFVLEHL